LCAAAELGELVREIRLFVSSPDDALMERKRLAQVVERLNGEMRGIATVRPVRWEKSFYKAHATFQKQIPEAAECEIVIGILRHRLGTELPDEFPKMPNGKPYPSGTAYEVLSALERRREGELPDVYVFRYSVPPTVSLDDPVERRRVESQWEGVKAFFSDWFVTPEGHFKAGFQTFDSTDGFEEKAEALLRQWIADRILHGRSVVWPVAIRGSPFRGLEAFDAEHAPVFFGRSRDIAKAVNALQETAERGTPYLLVIGPSGTGKSSIMRAGLAPRIVAPGVVSQVDVWRVVTMRPGEKGGDPFIALAEALLEVERGPETEDSGYGVGLAEIAEGGFATPQELAVLLAHADSTAVRLIVHALERVAEAERADAGYERPVKAALLLLVDQLDELLGSEVPDDVRRTFALLLGHLCRSGQVWVLTTLRADLYERYIAVPELLELKSEGTSYDLQPPGPAELAEIVRAPARAAELVYETDADGRSLDERLLADAERADILPLVQFTLNRLFEERVETDGEIRLTHAAYEAMGGLDGAIDHEAERALAGLGEAELKALPRLLRELATPSRSGANRGQDSGADSPLTIRTVAYERLAHDQPSTRLLEALIEARILLTSGEGNVRSVRIAHQRVLNSWKRARDIVAEHADFFRIRQEVEDERRRWEDAGKPRDLLIPRGLRLAEAESIQSRFKDEIPEAARAFVALSGSRARLRQRLTTGAAVIFFGVAIAAGYLGWLSQQRAAAEKAASERAQRNFSIARQTVDGMIVQVAEGLRGSAGVPIETIRNVLSDLESAVDRLNRSAPEDISLRQSRVAMLLEFGATYASAGESTQAIEAYDQAIAAAESILEERPDDLDVQRSLTEALQRLGRLYYHIGNLAEALDALNEALALDRELAAALSDDLAIWNHISFSLNDIGDLKRRAGDSAAALSAYQEGVDIGRRLVAADPGNVEWQEELAVSLIHLADVKAALGDVPGALDAFAEGLATWRKISDTDPGNFAWLHEVGMALNSIGDIQFGDGQLDEAKASFEEGLKIYRRLVQSDPGNRKWQGDLASGLERVGDIRLREGDLEGARTAFEECLSIRRNLTRLDAGHLEWRRDVASSLFRIGEVRRRSGDAAGMQSAYEEGIEILRQLIKSEPGNTRWQRNLAGALKTLGGQRYAAGDTEEGERMFDEALALRRSLIELDPTNSYWQVELAMNLKDIADWTTGPYRAAVREEALAVLAELREQGVPTDTYAELEQELLAMGD
jgi:tetratricopeptide (TPR) repeat protein